MADKLGIYITKLMTTILDKEQEEYLKKSHENMHNMFWI